MKKSSVIRIVVWSLAIVCLTSILLAGLGLRPYRSRTVSATKLELEPVTEPTVWTSETATAGEKITVRTSPSVNAGHCGELAQGTELSITRREIINGQEWAYITSPIQGWIQTKNLNKEAANVTVTYTQPAKEDVSGYSCPAADVSSISIDWLAGNITILPGEDDRIRVESTEGDHPMVTKVKNGKLSIDFCEETWMNGFRISGPEAKDLTITVPKDWRFRELEVDAADSKLHLQGLTIQEVDIDAASGQADIANCSIGSLEIDTASGDVNFTGTLDILECDAVSAGFYATLANTPKRMEMNSASGSMSLSLPADAGFTVRMEGLNTQFTSDFDTVIKNGAYVHGDGSCKIEMESMSGIVNIKKFD